MAILRDGVLSASPTPKGDGLFRRENREGDSDRESGSRKRRDEAKEFEFARAGISELVCEPRFDKDHVAGLKRLRPGRGEKFALAGQNENLMLPVMSVMRRIAARQNPEPAHMEFLRAVARTDQDPNERTPRRRIRDRLFADVKRGHDFHFFSDLPDKAGVRPKLRLTG